MPSTTPANAEQAPVHDVSMPNRRERLRFSDFNFSRLPSGACTAEVTLEWQDGMRVVGRASGQSSPLGDLRLAADAAIKALEEFSEGALHFELIGVKLVRAFDENLVIVSVIERGEHSHARLIGCFLAPNDANRGAALAVLNATNRVLGNFLATR
jgi:hypothetical protein